MAKVNKTTTLDCKNITIPVVDKFIDAKVEIKQSKENQESETFMQGKCLAGFLYMGVHTEFLDGVLSQLKDLGCLSEERLQEMQDAKRSYGSSSSKNGS